MFPSLRVEVALVLRQRFELRMDLAQRSLPPELRPRLMSLGDGIGTNWGRRRVLAVLRHSGAVLMICVC